MRLIDADAFDNVLQTAQMECKKNGGNFRFGVLNNVRGNLAKAPTVGGWISVKDRLPGEWATVLTFQPALSDGLGLIRTAVYIGTGKWREAERHELMELPVTHWMPLPSTEGLNEA